MSRGDLVFFLKTGGILFANISVELFWLQLHRLENLVCCFVFRLVHWSPILPKDFDISGAARFIVRIGVHDGDTVVL